MNDKDILAMTIAANAIWTDFAKLTVDVNIHPDTNLPISVEACVISNKGTVLMRGRDVPLTDGVPGKEDAMDQAWGSLKEKVAAEIIMFDRYAQTKMDKQVSHYQSKIKHWKNMLTILYPQEG